MRVRLARCGMRSVSLAVDVTNYLMIELGQPLHAFDRSALTGPIVVRRARPGEQLETLDHVVRALDPDDILITDESGPISLAGTMGGLATEITPDSADLVIEAAHFSMAGTARMSRRHRLFSEASARFERGVDRELPLRASARAVSLLAALGGGTVVPGCTHAQVDVAPVTIGMTASYPDQVAGVVYGLDAVTRRLRQVGCEVHAETAEAGAAGGAADPDGPGGHVRHEHARHDRTGGWLTVTPPSWRPDLTDPADLAEEVIRLEGYENVPVRMPRAAAGHGLTPRQRLRRTLGRHLASRGYVEVLSNPFGPAADADRLGLPPGDPRRSVPQIANPIKDDEPLLRAHAAARPAAGADPQHRPRVRRRGPVRAGQGVPDPAGRARRGPDPGRGPRAHRGGGGDAGRGPARPAAAPGCGAGRRTGTPRAGGERAARPAGRTPSRRPARRWRSMGCRSP